MSFLKSLKRRTRRDQSEAAPKRVRFSLESLESRLCPSWSAAGSVLTYTPTAGDTFVSASESGAQGTITASSSSQAPQTFSGITHVVEQLGDHVYAINALCTTMTAAETWDVSSGAGCYAVTEVLGSVVGGALTIHSTPGQSSYSVLYEFGSVLGGGSLNYASTHAQEATDYVMAFGGTVDAGSQVSFSVTETYSHAATSGSGAVIFSAMSVQDGGSLSASVDLTAGGGAYSYGYVALLGGSFTGHYGDGATVYSNVGGWSPYA